MKKYHKYFYMNDGKIGSFDTTKSAILSHYKHNDINYELIETEKKNLIIKSRFGYFFCRDMEEAYTQIAISSREAAFHMFPEKAEKIL